MFIFHFQIFGLSSMKNIGLYFCFYLGVFLIQGVFFPAGLRVLSAGTLWISQEIQPSCLVHCKKFPRQKSSQVLDRPGLYRQRLDCCPRDSCPYPIWTKIRTYLDGQKNTYYIVFCAFRNGIIHLKNLDTCPYYFRTKTQIYLDKLCPARIWTRNQKQLYHCPGSEDFFSSVYVHRKLYQKEENVLCILLTQFFWSSDGIKQHFLLQ